MTARSAWRASLIAAFVVGCSTMTPTISPAPLTGSPTVGPTSIAAPSSTPEPTIEPDPLPSTSVFGWWEDSIKYCHPPAYYRLAGEVTAIGSCPGVFLSATPKVVTLDVGQDIDMHMAVPRDGSPPFFPLPEPEDTLIALGWLIHDKATMTYRALLPGATRLISNGACESLGAPGSCPILEIHVRDINMTCTDVPEDLCRAAASQAVLGFDLALGQRIVGWGVTPSQNHIDWPGCGRVFGDVTLDLRDPAAQVSRTMGQPDPDGHPLVMAWCTY